jgi:hypothetical protein
VARIERGYYYFSGLSISGQLIKPTRLAGARQISLTSRIFTSEVIARADSIRVTESQGSIGSTCSRLSAVRGDQGTDQVLQGQLHCQFYDEQQYIFAVARVPTTARVQRVKCYCSVQDLSRIEQLNNLQCADLTLVLVTKYIRSATSSVIRQDSAQKNYVRTVRQFN